MDIFEIVSIATPSTIAVISIIAFILKQVKIVALTKKLNNVSSYTSRNEYIFDCVQVIEQKYKPYERKGLDCAAQKLEDVVSKTQLACLANGWNFDEKAVTDYIETLIGFSKVVNTKESTQVEK